MFLHFFFFSSRRRHTRYIGDWSSDVCSSDLITLLVLTASALAWGEDGGGTVKGGATTTVAGGTGAPSYVPVITKLTFRSEERRVGKECRSRWLEYPERKKI